MPPRVRGSPLGDMVLLGEWNDPVDVLVGVLYYLGCKATIVRSANRDKTPGRDHVLWLALRRRSSAMSAKGCPRVKFVRVGSMLFFHPGQWDAAKDKGGFLDPVALQGRAVQLCIAALGSVGPLVALAPSWFNTTRAALLAEYRSFGHTAAEERARGYRRRAAVAARGVTEGAEEEVEVEEEEEEEEDDDHEGAFSLTARLNARREPFGKDRRAPGPDARPREVHHGRPRRELIKSVSDGGHV